MPYYLKNKPQAINASLPQHEEFYRLEVDFNLIFNDQDARTEHVISIPSGFICDGSSIPRILWTLIGLHKEW
ncbi:MAG: DUF1353 domain-containing protein [Owenweeksia sp.]|nr:DUF1353 domain-containing protein [Owenweeksia sp.]